MNGSPVVESTTEGRVEELRTTTQKMLEKAMESLQAAEDRCSIYNPASSVEEGILRIRLMN